MKKKLFMILLCGCVLISLTGCGGETNKFIGTWRSPYISNKVSGQGLSYLEIRKDGTYTKTNYIDGNLMSKTEGEYEIGGNEIILYTNESHTSWTECNYRSEALVSGDLYYTRYDASKENNSSPNVEVNKTVNEDY